MYYVYSTGSKIVGLFSCTFTSNKYSNWAIGYFFVELTELLLLFYPIILFKSSVFPLLTDPTKSVIFLIKKCS